MRQPCSDVDTTGRHAGQNLSEYVLVLGLVVLVSLAGLMLFANNLGTMGQNMLALITPNGGGGVAADGDGGDVGTALEPTGPTTQPVVQAMYDPSTGMITFTGEDGGTDGTVATGEQGIELAVLGLQQLAENPLLDDGTPADNPDISGLADLSRLAGEIEQAIGGITAETGSYDWLVQFSETFQANGEANLLGQFTAAYEVLTDFVAVNPQYSTLLQQARDYTGIISTIGYYEYYGVAQDQVGNTDLGVSNVDKFISGTNIVYESVSLPSGDVSTATDGLQELADSN